MFIFGSGVWVGDTVTVTVTTSVFVTVVMVLGGDSMGRATLQKPLRNESTFLSHILWQPV